MVKQEIRMETGSRLFRPGELFFINKVSARGRGHLHGHQFIEIAYVASGNGIHLVGGKSYQVTRGDLFVIDYNTLHEFRHDEKSDSPDLIVYNCIFKPEFIDNSLFHYKDFSDIICHFAFRTLFCEGDENPVDIKLIGKDTREVEALYEKMYREYLLQDTGYEDMIRALITELLIIIFRLCKKTADSNDTVNLSRRKIIDDVIRYMRRNFSEEFNLSDLSLEFYLSKNSLCKLFKDTTGMTVTEYVQKIRIEEACSYLRQTDDKIITVANRVGYSDIKFFNKIFKRITGKTPGQYRNSMHN